MLPRQWAPFLLLGAGLALHGCQSESSGPPPESRRPPPPGQTRPAAPVPLEQLMQRSLGSTYRKAGVQGKTAVVEYSLPKHERESSDQHLKRTIALGGRALSTIFKQEKGVQVVRLVALDAGQPSRRLLVFSMDRAASSKLNWERDQPIATIVKTIRVEQADPTVKSFIADVKQGR